MEQVLAGYQNIFHRELLKKVLTRLFGVLEEDQFNSIEPYFQWIQLPGGEVLMQEGDVGDSSYILITGRLRAVIQGGLDLRVIGEISEGETVGEMSLITGAPRSATIYAIRDCVLVQLLKADFEKIVFEYPATLMKITQLLINRLVLQNQGKGPRAKLENIAIVNLNTKIDTAHWAERLEQDLHRFGTTKRLDPKTVNQEVGIKEIANSTHGEYEKYNRLSSWLDGQEQKYDFLLYIADLDQDEWSKRCLRQADYVFIIVHGEGEDLLREKVWINKLSLISKASHCLIICQNGPSHPAQTDQIKNEYKIKEHFHFNLTKTDDYSRLARKIAGKSIGLVLSGGGARGVAHLGVYRALVERGFPIDLVGGTSIGSLMAALIAMHLPVEDMINLTRHEFMRNPTSDYSLVPFISIIKGHKLERALMRYFGDQAIEDLWIPYFCVSSNLSKTRAEHHTEGLLRQAIRASISIPGVLPPVIKQTEVLVDGGIFNNLPIDFMQEFGAGTIIAVDLDGGHALHLDESIKPSNWTYLKSRWSSVEDGYDKLPGLINTLTRATIASSHDRAKRNISLVNILFSPSIHKYGIMNWKSYDKILAEGYQHAQSVLDQVDIGKYF